MVRKIPLGEISKTTLSSPAPNSPFVVKPVTVNSESLKTFEEWMKIAADNKITSKNTWSASLIDYFSELTFFKDGNSINFQRASCTLDGCVKIYTSRVDSVVDETGKLLSGLSEETNNSKKDDNLELEGDEDEKVLKKKSTKMVETLEKNTENLNLKSFDLEWNIDPLFKKTCADFDEGGARGLLMNNLCMDVFGRLKLDASDSKLDEEYSNSEEKKNDLSKLKGKTSFKIEYRNSMLRAKELEICPTFMNFDAKQPLSALKIPDSRIEDIIPVKSSEDLINSLGIQSDSETDEQNYESGGFDDQFNQDFDGQAAQETEGRGNRRQTLLMSMVSNDDAWLSYFDQGAAKNWAGPEHWKVRLQRAAPLKTEGTKRAPKKVTTVDFLLAEPVDPSNLFAKSSVSITLSKNVITERMSENHLLPKDLKYSAKNLISLFTKPNWSLQKYTTQKGVPIQGALWNVLDSTLADSNRQSFGIPSDIQASNAVNSFDYEDDDNDFGDDSGPIDMVQTADDDNAEIGEHLVSEPKLTRMLKMNYAKVAKRVDVKALKENMWKELSPVSEKPLEFTKVISGLGKFYNENQYKDLSVSYCFISLLHLANEKNLEIKASSKDLIIARK